MKKTARWRLIRQQQRREKARLYKQYRPERSKGERVLIAARTAARDRKRGGWFFEWFKRPMVTAPLKDRRERKPQGDR